MPELIIPRDEDALKALENYRQFTWQRRLKMRIKSRHYLLLGVVIGGAWTVGVIVAYFLSGGV